MGWLWSEQPSGAPKTGLHARVTVLFRLLRIKKADRSRDKTAGPALLPEFCGENQGSLSREGENSFRRWKKLKAQIKISVEIMIWHLSSDNDN